MNRHRLTPIVFALLAVVALSLSAATLDVVQEGPMGSGGDAGVGGEGSTFDSGGSQSIEPGAAAPVVVTVLRLLFGVVVVLGFVALVVQVSRDGWRSLVPVVLGAVGCVLVVVVLYYAFAPSSSHESDKGLLSGGQFSIPNGSSASSGSGAPTVSDVPSVLDAPVVLFMVLGLAVMVGVIVLSRTTGDRLLNHQDEHTSNDTDRTDVQAVGTAAGRDADSIETDEVLSNAIYHAWEEMTTHLDLSQDTSTPREFARAAVAAGMAREDVEELTQLFETTRYGEQAITDRREQRARTALRQIEQEYAADETTAETER